jgi:hypothetical protein
MTAINIAVVAGGAAAHIVSDGAVYNSARKKVLPPTNKVKVLPQSNTVVTFTGSVAIVRAATSYCDSCCSFDELVSRFPIAWNRKPVLRAMCAYFKFLHRLRAIFDARLREAPPITAFAIFFVGYSESKKRICAVCFSSESNPPFEPVEDDMFLTPGGGIDAVLARGLLPSTKSLESNPERWASGLLAVMNLQRDAYGPLKIGRFATHTHITARGIFQRCIHRWDDTVGAEIGG